MGNQPNQNSEKEVDITELLAVIYRKIKIFLEDLFGLLIELMIYVRSTIFNHIKSWLIITLLFLGLSAYLYYNFLNTKLIQATVSSPYLKGLLFKDYINKLDNITSAGQYTLLASGLDIPFEMAKNIKSIETHYFNLFEGISDDYIVENEYSLDSLTIRSNIHQQNFIIILQLGEIQQGNIAILQTKILDYIKKNNYLNQNYNGSVKSLMLRKNFLLRQLEQLDTLDKVAIDVLQKNIGTQLNFFNETETDETGKLTIKLDLVTPSLDITRSKLEIVSALEKVEKSLEKTIPIEIITPFNPFYQKNKLKQNIQRIAYILYGFALVFFIFKDINSYLVQYKKD